MTKYKFDVFAALKAVDKNDGDWFSKLSEDSKKAFVAPIFLRFAAAPDENGIAHEMSVTLINEFLNKNADTMMTEHPELMFRLAAMCGIGRKVDRKWLPGHSRKNENAAEQVVAQYHPTANDHEISILMSLYTQDSFKEFVESVLSPQDAKEAIKAFKSYGK